MTVSVPRLFLTLPWFGLSYANCCIALSLTHLNFVFDGVSPSSSGYAAHKQVWLSWTVQYRFYIIYYNNKGIKWELACSFPLNSFIIVISDL